MGCSTVLWRVRRSAGAGRARRARGAISGATNAGSDARAMLPGPWTQRAREDRDRINEKVMADPRLKEMMDPKSMPFDGMRMFWGGFKSIVEA